MAASRYITEGFFFSKSLSREREMKVFFFPTPVEKRRKRSGAQHRRLDEGTTGSCTRQSLIDAVAHTNASVHACTHARMQHSGSILPTQSQSSAAQQR